MDAVAEKKKVIGLNIKKLVCDHYGVDNVRDLNFSSIERDSSIQYAVVRRYLLAPDEDFRRVDLDTLGLWADFLKVDHKKLFLTESK